MAPTKAQYAKARELGVFAQQIAEQAGKNSAEVAQTLGISRKEAANVITGRGDFVLEVVFDPGVSGFEDEFVFVLSFDDATPDRRVGVAAGGSYTASIGQNSDVVVTAVPPVAPAGWVFRDPVFDPESGATVDADGETVEVTYTIERQEVPLTIGKVLVDEDESGYVTPFDITYTVFMEEAGNEEFDPLTSENGLPPVVVPVDAGDSVQVDVPVNSVVVVEETLPADPEGFEFAAPVLDPVDGQVAISGEFGPVTVTNTITAVVPEG